MNVSRSLQQLIAMIAISLLAFGSPAAGAGKQRGRSPESTWLAAHNSARADMRLPPLRWSWQLADDAEKWAEALARRNTFADASPHVLREQGENLWLGTRNAYTPYEMIESFLSENRYFPPGTFPRVSKTGNWTDVGHYTQIIWPQTQWVGCAMASNQYDDELVCRYWPAGNTTG